MHIYMYIVYIYYILYTLYIFTYTNTLDTNRGLRLNIYIYVHVYGEVMNLLLTHRKRFQFELIIHIESLVGVSRVCRNGNATD